MELSNVVETIQKTKNNIILIYGFNGTGKTKLSREYLRETRHDNKPSGVYYNAFSEDIFTWDNDTENGEKNIRLIVKKSRLNDFHSGFTEEEVIEKLEPFRFKFKFKFNFYGDRSKGIESIKFVADSGEELFFDTDEIPSSGSGKIAPNIKISRGEERIFIWCFFLALFERGDLTTQQSNYFFIDDPVSSLDDHNIFTTALTVLDLIEEHYKSKKIIITTHHIGLFSILSNRLARKGAKHEKKTECFALNRKEKENAVALVERKKGIPFYHLYLWNILENARGRENGLHVFHFALLRQLLEIISSFFGVEYFSYALEKAEVGDIENTVAMINSLSHHKPYRLQGAEMNDDQKKVFIDILDKIKEKYNFRLPKEPKEKAKK